MKTFEQLLEYGMIGERITDQYLKKLFGLTIHSTFQYNPTKTPYYTSKDDEYKAADHTVFKNGKTFFIDSKRKSRWYDKNNCTITGINLDQWHNYYSISQKTGIPFYIMFIHDKLRPNGFVNKNYGLFIAKIGQESGSTSPYYIGQGGKQLWLWHKNDLTQVMGNKTYQHSLFEELL